MPTCIEKQEKKKSNKVSTGKKSKKSKETTKIKKPKNLPKDSPKNLPKEIVISVLHPSPERNGDVIDIPILQHDELRLFGSDLLTSIGYTIGQSIFLQPVSLFEITGDSRARSAQDDRMIRFILSPSGNSFVSTMALKHNSIYELEIFDVRSEDLSFLSSEDITEIRELFMKIDVTGNESIGQKQIIDYCWKEEKKHLDELKELCGLDNWDAIEEERKINLRLKILLSAFKSAHVNLGNNLSWKEFLLYEARKRRALRNV